jgi:hypothetical protein
VANRFGLQIDDLHVTCLPEYPRCIPTLDSRSIEQAGQAARRKNFCSFDAEYWSEHTPQSKKNASIFLVKHTDIVLMQALRRCAPRPLAGTCSIVDARARYVGT